MAHVYINVPEDVECVAEVEARAFSQDMDGDYFESGDIVRKPALAQAEWFGGQKRYTVKALLPGDEGQGVLKIYAGPKGLMVSHRPLHVLQTLIITALEQDESSQPGSRSSNDALW
jgi:bifunctional glutamyl/prolyl-tRNA synthetase